MYPEPTIGDRGHLPVTDGHSLWWERFGTPGAPVSLILHGGPGSGLSPRLRRMHNPGAWDVIGFDQRGAGRSIPQAADTPVAVRATSAAHHVADMEALRRHLGVDRWMLFGGSWGATLALAYTVSHPDRVTGLVLAGVTTTSAAEVEWFAHDLRMLLPQDHAALVAAVGGGPADGGQALAAAYAQALADHDRAEQAATAWCAWETALATASGAAPPQRYHSARFRLGFARQVTRCFATLAGLDHDALYAGIEGFGALPGELVHAAMDISAPLATAWTVSRLWPGARLTVVPGMGHSVGDDPIADATIAAISRMAGRLRAPLASLT